jgi:phosphoglycerate dehydrogenase-like enzyme
METNESQPRAGRERTSAPLSERPKIVVPGDEPVQIAGSPQLDRLRGRAEVVVYRDRPGSVAEQVQRVQDAEIIINSHSQLMWPADLLAALPRLRMISTCGIGTDAIDLAAARERGIVVANIPGKTAAVVAEHALALMLAVARRLAFQTKELQGGRWTWRESIFLGGKTLGVVGTGSIGAACARLGQAIGMKVVAWTWHPSPERAQSLGVRFVELDELLRSSDVVSLHLKLTPESRGLIGPRELALMKPGSLLVNTARGGLVDMPALVAALQSEHLAGAGLDVFDQEPLPADHPLLACDQIVLTPHNADQTPEGIDLLNSGAVENVLAFLSGKPQNVVT